MPLNDIARNAAADAIADLVAKIRFHTANPGSSGASPISGADVSVTGNAWTEAGGSATNNVAITVPRQSGNNKTASHFSLLNSSNQQLAWGIINNESGTATPVDLTAAPTTFDVGNLGIAIPAGSL